MFSLSHSHIYGNLQKWQVVTKKLISNLAQLCAFDDLVTVEHSSIQNNSEMAHQYLEGT